MRENVDIVPNGTTNITDGIIDHTIDTEPHVLAARLWVDDKIVARDVDWPQPFKYLDFADRGLEVKRVSEASDQQVFQISTERPVKCLVFEERDGVRFSDSAMDIVPGDVQTVTVTGLRVDEKLKYKFLGQ